MVTEPLTDPFLQTIQYDGIITEYLEWRTHRRMKLLKAGGAQEVVIN